MVSGEPATMAYYSRRESCGHVRMATVDRPEHKRAVARDLAGAVRRGETVRRASVEAVRGMKFCDCKD